MIGGRVVAEFQHVAEDGDAAAACTGRAFRLSRAATMLAGLPLKLSSIRVAPPAVCSTPRPVMMPTSLSSLRQRRRIETGGMDRGQRRQRILQPVRRAGRQAERDLLAGDVAR